MTPSPERFFEDRKFTDRAEMDRMRPTEQIDHPESAEIEMWGDAAQTVIEDV